MSNRYWERAWSLVEGCTPLSAACQNCWSAAATHMRQHQNNPRIKARYAGLTDDAGRFNGTVRLMWEDILKPLSVKRPTVWSVWNDLFHEAVPFDFIHHALRVMAACKDSRFLVLTKRPERIYSIVYAETPGGPFFRDGAHLPNVWLGTTVESQQHVGRLNYLWTLSEMGWHTFLSAEPLLGRVDLGEYRLAYQWAIIGAETGPHARPMQLDWARLIARDCVNAGVPLFVKSVGKGLIPPDLAIRQLPWRPT